MRKKLVINDLHIGVNRVAGATPMTAAALRARVLKEARALLMAHVDKDIIINGDLFDAFDIPMGDALAFYEIVCEWLAVAESDLVLGRGNHDVSKDSSRLSAFDFVGAILTQSFPQRVRVVSESQFLYPEIYMVPHYPNQALFDLELAKAEKLENTLVLVHANYENFFAAQSDNSLNVPAAWAEMMGRRGNLIFFGHEHQGKAGPGAYVAGNQIPTSVSDCLGNDRKYAHVFHY